MKRIKPFINRFDVDSEESLISFLYRLSIANHYESLKMIGDELGINWWEMSLNTFDEKACDELSYLCKMDKSILYSKSYHSILKGLDENQYKLWFTRSKSKYCPKCLAEKKIHKFIWGLKPVSICTRHSGVLLSKCTSCQRNIPIASIIKGSCNHCNFNLELGETVSVHRDELFYVAHYHFQQLLIKDKAKIFKKLSVSKILNLFYAMFRLFDGFDSFLEWNECFGNKRICLNNVNETEYTVSFTNVYWMLFIDFPQNFIRALEVFHDSDSPRKKYRKRQFANFLSSHKEFDFVKKAFESFKEKQITKGLVPRNVRSFNIAAASKLERMYYTKKDICKSFGISNGEVNKMCENNILKPKKVVIATHTNYYFGKQETAKIIKAYISEKNDLITKKTAAEILGISVEAMFHLIEKEILVQKEASIDKQYLFISKKSIDSLLMKLNAKAIIIDEEEVGNFISFKKCLTKFTASGLQIGKLLQWATHNKINFYSMTRNASITELYFDESELVHQLHKEDIEMNGYNLGDVSKILGYTERTLHKMIKANLITPTKVEISKNGRRIYFFDNSQINEFKENYITSVEASVKYNVNYSTLNNFSHKKILKNYFMGVCKKTLFKKNELESVLIKRGFIKHL